MTTRVFGVSCPRQTMTLDGKGQRPLHMASTPSLSWNSWIYPVSDTPMAHTCLSGWRVDGEEEGILRLPCCDGTDCRIGDSGAGAISNGLKTLTHMNELELSGEWCDVDDSCGHVTLPLQPTTSLTRGPRPSPQPSSPALHWRSYG